MKLQEALIVGALGAATGVGGAKLTEAYHHETEGTVDIEVTVFDCKDVHDALAAADLPMTFYNNRVYRECWRIFTEAKEE